MTRRDSNAVAAARAALRAFASQERAKGTARYFKAGPGEYGEGDVFVGVSVPDVRKVARAHADLTLDDLATLLLSEIHEERLLALIVLVRRFERSKSAEARRAIFELYMGHLDRVNNWDLVDTSAAPIVGASLRGGDRRELDRLARSKHLWSRRVAMIATHHYIKDGDVDDALRIATMLLGDRHDLIHKAVGWMLREVGERAGRDRLRAFLEQHAARMPRTALRYAIEKLPDAERKRWLAVPRVSDASSA
ncbi:MAG TPA: DNA alkylation repair protein [Polyangiaceae bacterium]|nr:DNA alkylation repair protein [Polyangiaceae bacterium]